MKPYTFSVIVPLYNKQNEIGDTLRSILAQRYLPLEVVVVNDGSTDGSADVVRSFNSPLIRLITQPNAGECAARNRAIAEARGEYLALLDADDTWDPGYLEEIARLIDRYPGCGMYSTAFHIVSREGVFPSHSPKEEGVVDNFFRQSLSYYVSIPSTSTIPAFVFREVGGFPEGMRMGGDQYMWVKIARRYPVCFLPKRLLNYSLVASNRSAAIYTPESTPYSFREFYDPQGDFYLNEYLARVELGKALTISAKGGTEVGRSAEKFYRYTRCNRRAWYKLWVLNRIPMPLRAWVFRQYNRLAWKLAKKGL